MSSGFFSEKEAEQNRISKQQEWERVRKPNDSKEAPLDQLRNGRPLHQQLEENRVAEQEALNDSLALKNQIRGINEDESAYLNSISKAEVKIERERQKEADLLIGALKRNQSKYTIRNEKQPVLVENSKTPSDENGIKKKKKQSSLLAGAIKRKSSADGNEPKSKESKASSNQSEVQLKAKLLSPKKITAITIKPNSTKQSNAEPSALLSLGAQYSDSDDDKNSDTSDSDADSDGVEIRPSSNREGKMKA